MIQTRKRGNLYHVDCMVGDLRLRGTLGTQNRKEAVHVKSRLEAAVRGGASSPEWDGLRRILPSSTYKRFSTVSGVRSESTVSGLLSIFWTHVTQRVRLGKMSPATEKRYVGIVEQFAAMPDLPRTLSEITPEVIERWNTWRLGQILSRPNAKSGSALTLEVAVLHTLFQLAVERKLLTENPVRSEGRPGANPENGAEPFTAEELAKLRTHAGDDLLAFLVLRWTGLRGSDAVTLSWTECDLTAKQIDKVCQKNGKRVVISMHEELESVLYRASHSFAGTRPTVLGIPNRPALYTRMKALGKRAGVRNCRPHRFRDTYAVDMLVRGASIYDVAKLLGDSIRTVEQHYTPFVPALQDRVRKLMQESDGLEVVHIMDRPKID